MLLPCFQPAEGLSKCSYIRICCTRSRSDGSISCVDISSAALLISLNATVRSVSRHDDVPREVEAFPVIFQRLTRSCKQLMDAKKSRRPVNKMSPHRAQQTRQRVGRAEVRLNCSPVSRHHVDYPSKDAQEEKLVVS